MKKQKSKINNRFEMIVRYVPHLLDYEAETTEKAFANIERNIDYRYDLCALILVDVWNYHFIKEYYMRAEKIVQEKIKPVVEACRHKGIQVIHAPTPAVADKYPEYRHNMAFNGNLAYTPLLGQNSGWPLPEMMERDKEFKQYDLNLDTESEPKTMKQNYEKYMIHPALGPEKDDLVIANGFELHDLLSKYKKFHLFYTGFVSNGCILERDYGVRIMGYCGYDIILLRDCTVALETADSYKEMRQTRSSIENLEFWISTATSKSFIEGLSVLEEQPPLPSEVLHPDLQRF